MISAEFKKQSNVAAANFLVKKGKKIARRVEITMREISVDLQSYVKKYKLSGQVLKNRTGNLRRAITRQTVASQGIVSAIVGVSPNASKYAAIHEFGGTINVPEVSGRLMVFQLGGETVFTMRHRAFTVNMPERSYLRSSLRENKQTYLDLLRTVVSQEAATP